MNNAIYFLLLNFYIITCLQELFRNYFIDLLLEDHKQKRFILILDSQKFHKIIKPVNPYRHHFSSVCVE